MLSTVYIYSTMKWGEHMQIQSLLAYELFVINGCGTRKNNIHGSEVALVSSPNIKIVTKKSKQTSIRKNL